MCMRYLVLLFMIDTLREYISHGTKPGPKPHLNASEEKSYVILCVRWEKSDIGRHCDRSRMLLKQFPKRKVLLERKRHPMDGLGNP